MCVYPKYNLEYTNIHCNVKSPPSGLYLLRYTDCTSEMSIHQPILAEMIGESSHKQRQNNTKENGIICFIWYLHSYSKLGDKFRLFFE